MLRASHCVRVGLRAGVCSWLAPTGTSQATVCAGLGSMVTVGKDHHGQPRNPPMLPQQPTQADPAPAAVHTTDAPAQQCAGRRATQPKKTSRGGSAMRKSAQDADQPSPGFGGLLKKSSSKRVLLQTYSPWACLLLHLLPRKASSQQAMASNHDGP